MSTASKQWETLLWELEFQPFGLAYITQILWAWLSYVSSKKVTFDDKEHWV